MTNFHVMAGAHDAPLHPAVRRISMSDLTEALRRGADDFWAKPSHLLFLGLIYPVVGVFLAAWTSGNDAFQLVYPLMSGFALLGPFAAIGLYEISKRRELGMNTSWWHALDVRKSPALPAIAVVGALLVALFLIWIWAAHTLYFSLFGEEKFGSFFAFLGEVLTTSRGWQLIIWGNLLGAVFAVVALATTVVAFPLLLDRDVGAYAAIDTSFRAIMTNPVEMIGWGLIVAAGLVIGSIPLFAGLAIVVPVLGHATWHLYRRVVEPERGERRPM